MNNVISLNNNDISSRRFLRAKDIQNFFNIARNMYKIQAFYKVLLIYLFSSFTTFNKQN